VPNFYGKFVNIVNRFEKLILRIWNIDSLLHDCSLN